MFSPGFVMCFFVSFLVLSIMSLKKIELTQQLCLTIIRSYRTPGPPLWICSYCIKWVSCLVWILSLCPF